jgi:hypothetical protein
MTKTMTTRPLNTYSPRYLRSKTNILKYRETHKQEIADYMREYMREYVTRPHYVAHKERTAVRHYLCKPLLTKAELAKRKKKNYRQSSAIGFLGLTRAELAKKYNMSERRFVSYVSGREIDHVLSHSWLAKNHPEYLAYHSRWYNLQFVTESQNASKHSWVDTNSPDVQRILKLMALEARVKAA